LFTVDHSGVNNEQLIKEQAIVATVYKNKSVAEQNSVDIGAIAFGASSSVCI
jgi:3'5'-cyclic nucleotide phosphodiesterase